MRNFPRNSWFTQIWQQLQSIQLPAERSAKQAIQTAILHHRAAAVALSRFILSWSRLPARAGHNFTPFLDDDDHGRFCCYFLCFFGAIVEPVELSAVWDSAFTPLWIVDALSLARDSLRVYRRFHAEARENEEQEARLCCSGREKLQSKWDLLGVWMDLWVWELSGFFFCDVIEHLYFWCFLSFIQSP